jgi:hypothetical protein
VFALALPTQAQRWRQRVPDISGTWFLKGDEDAHCRIIQKGPGGHWEIFINEQGNRARGTVRGNRVFIPAWTDGQSQGLAGRIRGDRIIWPNGTFWSR